VVSGGGQAVGELDEFGDDEVGGHHLEAVAVLDPVE
jgi:hypothetical protein